MKTTETSSYKFEQQISNQINKWLESQTDEKFKNLSSTKYTGDEEKYFSDVFIENKENGKRIWVEVKKMKNSCLGNPSFKYTDGKWSCTTTDDDNQLADLYLEALNEGSKKFIDFCKSYLKTDDISIPKDLTPQLINAWKKSGSVEDTDNDVQFITNKIMLDDFGSKIAEFYKTVKNEPVYYMQVDDDLYILDPQYNALGLKTNDGKELKPISDVYKHGRMQFRAKGIEKKLKSGSKYYYNIVCDIKITSNESDDVYRCSFKTEEKWPKVKTTDDVIMESIIESIEQEELIFSSDVDEKIIRTALDVGKINNPRYSRTNFTKYFGQDNIKWCTLSINTEIVAIAAVEENNPFDGYVYINDIQTLIKGYGRTLLDEIFNNYKKVWLMADVTAGEDLLNYYRSLKLHEMVVPDSIYDCPAFFYCTKQCDIYKLEDHIEAFFANNNGGE